METSDTPPALDGRPRATWAQVVLFSLAISASAAVVATVLALADLAAFGVTFVIIRWLMVGVLILTPLLSQLSRGRLPIPAPMRTPWTALLLTLESIAFDILSAQL